MKDIVERELESRGIVDGSVLEGFRSVFEGLGVFQGSEWDRFLLQPDARGIYDAPDVVEWLHFLQAEMYKLVCVSFTRHNATDELGFSTGLATSFMSTLSRPTSHTIKSKYGRCAPSPLSAEFEKPPDQVLMMLLMLLFTCFPLLPPRSVVI